MALNNKPYDFVFLHGDMFDYQTGEQQLTDHLIQRCTDSFAEEKPFIYIRGNHEVRGKLAQEIKPYFTNYGNTGQFLPWI
ncbi:MAG: metallophosphoesterase [Chitinophagaceae bacterium]